MNLIQWKKNTKNATQARDMSATYPGTKWCGPGNIAGEQIEN